MIFKRNEYHIKNGIITCLAQQIYNKMAQRFAEIIAKCLVGSSSNGVLVLYHKPCRDGRMCNIIMKDIMHDLDQEIESHGIDPRNMMILPSDQIKNKVVFVLDACYDEETTKTMIEESTDLLVIDHHRFNARKLTNIPDENKHFSEKFCASKLLWNMANPDKKVPLLLQFIDDHDCYRKDRTKESKASKLLFDWIEKHGKDDEEINAEYRAFLKDDDLLRYDIDTRGVPLLEKYNSEILSIAKSAEVVDCKIEGVDHTVCRYPTPSFDKISDSGNKCMELHPTADFVCMYKEDPDTNSTSWTFRSTDEKTDVGALATSLGGGGHRNASGAKTVDYLGRDLPGMTDIVIRQSLTTNGIITKTTSWMGFLLSPFSWFWNTIFGSK